MAIDIEEIFRSGGRELIDFLDYCVRSIQLEPVFVFLVKEYQTNPSMQRALALYDVFCEPRSIARIKIVSSLPPKNLMLLRTINTIRNQQQELEQARAAALADPDNEPPQVRYTLPMKNLFDDVVRSIRAAETRPLEQIAAHYDPALTPAENLPGGGMNAAQRHFVDFIWEPQVRPFLVAAGFRRIGNIA